MGVIGLFTLLAVTALVALEGYNQSLVGKAQTDATSFITTLAKQYGFNAGLIVPHLVNLRFVALISPLALVISPVAWFSAIYLILTRAVHILAHFQKVASSVSTKGLEGVNSVTSELTYILTTVALVGYLLSTGCRLFCSSGACGRTTPAATRGN